MSLFTKDDLSNLSEIAMYLCENKWTRVEENDQTYSFIWIFRASGHEIAVHTVEGYGDLMMAGTHVAKPIKFIEFYRPSEGYTNIPFPVPYTFYLNLLSGKVELWTNEQLQPYLKDVTETFIEFSKLTK